MTRTKLDIDPNTGTDMARVTIKGMNQVDVRKCQDSIQDLCMGSGRGFPALDIGGSHNLITHFIPCRKIFSPRY